ncbi:MAG: D-glycerate dehydrogenase [candidate division WOR-3 bacterium]|nr:MAG: D-glycerate dehydrogenase [candidate division WOR-3 bacterium]
MEDKPKVLLTRSLPSEGINILQQHFNLELNPNDEVMSHDMIRKRILDKDGLACLLTDRIDATIIENAPKLKIIANYAVGYNNIDVATATARRIPVTNTPDVLTETTADLTFALVLSVARRIVEADKFLRAGKFKGWEPELMLGSDVYGKTLGIVGFGRIGRAVARRAQGFNMTVLYTDSEQLPATIERECNVQYRTLEGLLSEADYISLHTPLDETTYHLISEKEFRMMKESAYLINVARGPIVDEHALLDALSNGEITGCALDVFENEPDVTQALLSAPNTVLVPHIGSASVEARTKMAVMVAQNLIAVLVKGSTPVNVVNPEIYTIRSDS